MEPRIQYAETSDGVSVSYAFPVPNWLADAVKRNEFLKSVR